MAPHAQIEAAETIPGKTVSAALENDRFGLVICHDSANDRLENSLVRNVVNAISKREVDRIILACSNSDIAKLSGAWKIFAVFMEGNRHNTVGGIECFLDAVAMMNVDVDIEDSFLEAQQLQDGQDDI